MSTLLPQEPCFFRLIFLLYPSSDVSSAPTEALFLWLIFLLCPSSDVSSAPTGALFLWLIFLLCPSSDVSSAPTGALDVPSAPTGALFLWLTFYTATAVSSPLLHLKLFSLANFLHRHSNDVYSAPTGAPFLWLIYYTATAVTFSSAPTDALFLWIIFYTAQAVTSSLLPQELYTQKTAITYEQSECFPRGALTFFSFIQRAVGLTADAFSFFHPASIGLTADGVRAFPVEHLKFSLPSSEQLVSQRTDMRKFPGQTLIFPSCQVSSFRPASISLTADGVRAFPVEHLKFSLSSSEQLVSQRMEYEKSPGQTLIFPSCQVSSFRPASIGLTADGVSSFRPASIGLTSDGARKFQVEHSCFLFHFSEYLVLQWMQRENLLDKYTTTTPCTQSTRAISPGSEPTSRASLTKHPGPFSRCQPAISWHSLGGLKSGGCPLLFSLLGGVLWVRAEFRARSPPSGQHAKYALNLTHSKLYLGRFTDEEAEAVNSIQAVFGEESSTYIMALFTHGDRLEDKNIHTFVRESPKLLSFIKTCSGRFHVFNNKEQNPEQVIQLFEKIDKIVTGNDGQHYTSEMIEIEKAIEEEKINILKQNEEQRKNKTEALRAKLEADLGGKESLNNSDGAKRTIRFRKGH
ncbi:GTPase IMAP family member 7-like [Pimephales promelas]|nr:GTPase IMAP family member 7-like [Pimephales promelas]